MSYEQTTSKAILLLEDGTVFEGKSFGAAGTAVGEVVFTTSAVGFQETITDPSYFGQIITQTFPLTGNYGMNAADSESDRAHATGYIVREWCEQPSNFRCEETIDAFLKAQGVIGLYDIDTRALTAHLREQGTMNGVITNDMAADRAELLKMAKSFRIQQSVQAVSVTELKRYSATGERVGEVAVYDFGCLRSIIDAFNGRGYDVTLLPWNTPADQAAALAPDGIVLAGGPGNPEDCGELLPSIRALMGSGIPVMGIGLGHQLMALAVGAQVKKLPHGHRGGSQPVVDSGIGKTFVTSQNHGYAVDEGSLPKSEGEVFCRNINDKTCEGISYKKSPAFSIQFHPEAFTGTGDKHYYVGRFINMMNAGGNR
ncbi:glutamine-hydrolyzing carbamoyl-phosphate synthase small subunit [Clostridiaceae bacterium NSJ-31]|uniref:Carbamoyl phosphate synthase small chain n=1 Tax=Ligaoa zhengdingensis TaxID=2763658 RepID=A0A926DVZ7_9FIRM|nr:carbamoyl phosphate synthase small subunit [Ligaoa zhengdingensis]MBC8545746.1 glutamine-hydrolyzing carbamoyl-phosphate synthase small subunit [Ligaoa zhengdingensis]